MEGVEKIKRLLFYEGIKLFPKNLELFFVQKPSIHYPILKRKV